MRHHEFRTLIATAAVAGLMLNTAPAASATDLLLPEGAEKTATAADEADSHSIAVGSFSREGGVPRLTVIGQRSREAWRIPAQGLSIGAVADQLRAQLEDQGFTLRFRCATAECGGFDFRFQLPVLPLPGMFVDLGDYIYLSGAHVETGSEDPDQLVEAIVSRTRDSVYVQINRIVATPADTVPLVPPANTTPQVVREQATKASDEFIASLRSVGHATIPGLEFETGSTRLAGDTAPSLAELGRLLAASPDLRITLVGHTDTVGSLAANTAVSRARARAVADRLVAMPGVAPAQVSAEGVGYLAPVAGNETEAGRALNRRVEVVLVSGTLPKP